MAQLRNNEYYLKKLYRAAEVQDVNKDGKVTRADYDLMVSKYDAMDMPQEYKQELADAIYSTSDSLGLTDHTKSLTYDEIVNSWIDNVEKGGRFANTVSTRYFASSIQTKVELYL
jgi:hypothetical protein